jgi:ABC-2 type transport system ATP-binding protein
MQNGYAIETKNLTKVFGKFTALDKLNLRIEAGAIHGLLGPNGAGKTTSIKVLCGLLKPTSGEAYIFGKKVPDRSVLPRIGYMPQETALYPDLSVHHNLALYGELYGLSGRKIAEREKELLRFIALEKWKDAPVANLSGGMKHRVSLACSMIHEPEVLFLDEPTVGVDPELRAAFWEYFTSLKQAGVTIVLTTHYMDEAQHCDKIGLVRQGTLIAEGTPGEITGQTKTTNLEDAFLALARRQVPA